MKNCNNKGDIDFWQRSKDTNTKAVCIYFNLSLSPSIYVAYL